MVEFIKYKGFDHVFRYSGPWLWWLVGIYLTIPITFYMIIPFLSYKGSGGKRKTVTILVLGDIGHSPRMCYHAQSFSKYDYYINVCGYVETEPPISIMDDINVEIYPIDVIRNTSGLPFVLFAAKKIIMQIYLLFSLLFLLRGSDYFMIQNPPSIPLLAVLIIFIKLFSRNSRLVIDWHNLNYTILNLKFNNLNHPLVRFLKYYEKVLGRFAWLNITVTAKMEEFLVQEFGFNEKRVVTLYDRPAKQFVPLSDEKGARAELLAHPLFSDVENVSKYKILVSSTSFTPDEDFGILLDALKKYDQEGTTSGAPPVLLLVTGKGPLKQQFLDRVQALKFSKHVIIKSAWLTSEEYPQILSLADLGVSLHTSLSGIDLPMKIVDFFGVGVPVVTLSFPAIGELVKDGVNGLITSPKDSAISESDEMFRLIKAALRDPLLLAKLKRGALEESKNRWDANWSARLGRTFDFGVK